MLITQTSMKGFNDYTINVGGRLIDLSEPCVMGILNVTPDSFYAGSRRQTEDEIAARTNQIINEGALMIDVGAFSTRPGAAKVTSDEEMERMHRALTIVRREQPEAVLSIDTFRPEVAEMAVREFGAGIINDVSEGNTDGAFGSTTVENHGADTAKDGSQYPEMFRTVARLGVPYILMSTKPDVETMLMAFAKEVQQLRDLGQKDIILDPGFGFGKSLEQNYAVLANLRKLSVMGLPVLCGASRKSMIYRLNGTMADEALNGTTVINTIAMIEGGASILRVHDVKEAVEACKIVKMVIENR